MIYAEKEKDGLAWGKAIYEMAKEFIGDLKTRFFASVSAWVRNTIIVKGVQKLILMFNPVGAVVQAIITIGSTIKFFIDRAKQVAAFAHAVFDSITKIAGGNLKKAVTAVENSLAKALPVAIGFMANLAGIGGIVAKIKDVIKRLRQPIDKAVEKVVGLVADKVKLLMGHGKKDITHEQAESPEKTEKISRGLTAIDEEERKYLESNKISRENAEKVAVTVKIAHPVFRSLSVVDGGETWDYDYVASPGRIREGPEKAEGKTEVALEKGASRTVAKTANASNYRNIFLEANPNMPKNYQVHHSLPQKYENILNAAGINIHETQYLRGVNSTIHSKITNEWTKWDKSLGRTPTAQEIINFSKQLDNKYGNYWHKP